MDLITVHSIGQWESNIVTQSGEQVTQTDKRSERFCMLCTQERYEETFVYTDTRDLSSRTTFKVHTINLKEDLGTVSHPRSAWL